MKVLKANSIEPSTKLHFELCSEYVYILPIVL